MASTASCRRACGVLVAHLSDGDPQRDALVMYHLAAIPQTDNIQPYRLAETRCQRLDDPAASRNIERGPLPRGLLDGLTLLGPRSQPGS